MRIAFTICSNNYLALAKTLADSYHEHNPGAEFVICLVDKKSDQVDYAQFKDTEVIAIEDIRIPDFGDLADKYNIVELNTAVKPFFIEYLFKRDASVSAVVYLDPDIYVLGSFSEVDRELGSHTLMVTPHISQPYPLDDKVLPERTFLNYGIYNLGFIAVNRCAEADKFLSWWQERLRRFCYIDFADACFTDQIWINYAPLFFKDVKVSFHQGINAAYWNLEDRKITGDSQKMVNGLYPFVFIHISGFDPYRPEQISVVQTRIDIKQRRDLVPIYAEYARKVLANNYEGFKKIPCVYVARHREFKRRTAKQQIGSSLKNKMLYWAYKITPGVVFKTYKAINRELKYYNDL
ncbi:hypothetical protein BEL04_10005 [Mucilaginibacter sp. PPCGB 2223]|uniref:hypothetical protein n=1 Tax=Mucilaginibacter sp. PPCGB 2223 TaxID=1886027 RepID=UPI0008267625|nr:hypothetical protein [Mucilaginibacter sp. PPCGB 2223]OCX54560.1 hypothetical protein BEL04_10005 [Mucilaginibacter sp. PPCGB 2223]